MQTLTTADIVNRPAHVPFVISFGLGVDSTAVLVELVRRGIRPDLIQFANVGDQDFQEGELPETVAYLAVINAYLAQHGFPQVTVVKKRSKHASQYHNCLDNQTLPSLAFGRKGCSQKWKVDPMNHFCNHWAPAKACWKQGGKVIKAIGYDNSARDCERFATSAKGEAKRAALGKGDKKYVYWYPLQEWKIDRERCKQIIAEAGLPVPPKSACFYCPARKREEIVDLAQLHPVLARKAIVLERAARTGKHGLKSTKGLGRSFAWEQHLAEAGVVEVAGLRLDPTPAPAGRIALKLVA